MGWLGNALIIYGAWQIGHKRRFGFLLAIAGSVCWVSVGFNLGMLDLMFIELVMACIAMRNFFKWSKT